MHCQPSRLGVYAGIAMRRTWCCAGVHWLGSALRKKARKKGFSTGGIQSTLSIFRGLVSGRGASALAM